MTGLYAGVTGRLRLLSREGEDAVRALLALIGKYPVREGNAPNCQLITSSFQEVCRFRLTPAFSGSARLCTPQCESLGQKLRR
jgi:hypothetical protein